MEYQTPVEHPDMNMVICKHLMSLADGAERVDKEFDRLRSNGYLQYVEREVSRDPGRPNDPSTPARPQHERE